MHRSILAALLILGLTACGAQSGPGGDPGGDPSGGPGGDPGDRPAAEPLHDTIAYVTGDGDAIRLIAPDGSNDRPLWSSGQPDPEEVHGVWSMSWNPGATELAFVSTHENACSLFHSDVYAVGANGEGYRRVTQAPACAELAEYPSGTVRIPVTNTSFDSLSAFIYLQGAPGIQPVNLPPGGEAVVTFENVADFGDGEEWLQVAVLIMADNRDVLLSTAIDVQAGSTVTTPETAVFPPSLHWEARSPTWRQDGEALGLLYGFNSLTQLPARPAPLEFGTPILAEGVNPTDLVNHLAWAPTEATAGSLLYQGTLAFHSTGIYLVEEGSSSEGEQLVTFGSLETVLGLAWLPDGSGFVYSVTEGDYFGEDRSANLFHFDLGTGVSTRITDLTGDFAGQMSVSSDGQRLAFERAAEFDVTSGALVGTDVWMVGLDGSDPRLLVEDAYAPAWSW